MAQTIILRTLLPSPRGPGVGNNPKKLIRFVTSTVGNRLQTARELTEAEEDKLFDSGEFGTSKSRRLKWRHFTLEKDLET